MEQKSSLPLLNKTTVRQIYTTSLWGVSGMFLTIPALAVLKVVFDRVDGLKPYGLLLGDDTITKSEKPNAKSLNS